MSSPSEERDAEALPRLYGKYRGVVRDNKDPQKLGRVLAEVAQVPGMRSNWALPATPYAGPGVGLLMLPPVDALVWVEFEGGHPDFPIWSGCFWGQADQVPIVYGRSADAPAMVKVLKTESTTIIIDDTKDTGTVQITIVRPAISQHPVTLTFDSNGAELLTGVVDIKVNPESGIVATVSQTKITASTDAITASAQSITATANPSQLKIDGSSITLDSPQIGATASGPVSVSADATFSVKAGQITTTAASTSFNMG